MKKKCRYDSWFKVQSLKPKVLFGLVLVLLMACNQKKGAEALDKEQGAVYYCPMHPDVISHRPGKCPKEECHGMTLILKTDDSVLENVLKPVNNSILSSVCSFVLRSVFHPLQKATG